MEEDLPPPPGVVHDPSAALLRMLETTCKQRAEREAERDQLQRAADDYEELIGTLTSLPAKVEHKVMVPFGKLAFFPGSLRHTNEIMVLLGDNYFALRSAEQAAGIALRRAEYVRPQVAAAQADVDILTTRIEQIRAYGEMQDVRPGEFEIREPYFSDDEAEGEEEEDDDEAAVNALLGGGDAEEEEEEEDAEDMEGEGEQALLAALNAASTSSDVPSATADYPKPARAKALGAASLGKKAEHWGEDSSAAASTLSRGEDSSAAASTLSRLVADEARKAEAAAAAASHAASAMGDSDDDSDDDSGPTRPNLPPLSASSPSKAASIASARAGASLRGSARPAARVMPSGVIAPQSATSAAPAGGAAAAREDETAAFRTTVLEREPSRPPPTDETILMREISREKARLDRVRGTPSGYEDAFGMAPEAGDEEEEAKPKVSRFMASRRRQ